jgi:succinate dehydrogenase/fumarate reductase cytochrome b subunit
MNKLAVSSTAITGVIVVSFLPRVIAQSKYDEDGFTVFLTKSSDYMSGYSAGGTKFLFKLVFTNFFSCHFLYGVRTINFSVLENFGKLGK